MKSYFHQLTTRFPKLRFINNEPLSLHSTVRIGGLAEVFWQTTTSRDLVEVFCYCQEQRIPHTIIGWGANTLFADRGLSGLVIKNTLNNISLINHANITNNDQPILVEIESGTPLSFAINQLLDQNIIGMESWARIPATIGGAIYNNIHGENGKLFADIIQSVKFVDKKSLVKSLNADQLNLAYDYSIFHQLDAVIISAIFKLKYGDGKEGLAKVKSIAQTKAHHPPRSLGCVFQNLDIPSQQRLNLPTKSSGYLIDKVLKLGQLRIGDAQVSPKHAGFIENLGHATANEYLQVIKTITAAAKTQLNLILKSEIFYKGFNSIELAGLNISSDNTTHE